MNTSHPDSTFPVVIIGGGLAGLTAAAHLAARGVPPLLLDADGLWPGGRLAGGDDDRFQYQGREWRFSSEHGMHALWGGYLNMRAMLKRFTTVELQYSPGEEWINRWRREVRVVEAGQLVRFGWVPAPFHYLSLLYSPRFWTTITPLDFLSLPGFLFSIFWTLGLDPIREGIALDGLMIDEYFRGWTPNLRATFTGLAVNLLAAPKEHISLAAMIAAVRFYTMLRRDSWEMSYLPDNPHRALLQPLIAQIQQGGGRVIHGAEAVRLEQRAAGQAGWRVVFADQSRRGLRAVEAAQVILATNVPGAQRLLLNSPATEPIARGLRFPGVVRNASVRLWFNAAPREGAPAGMFTGDFLPDNFFWLHRLYDEFRDWHHETGGSAIELHLYAGDSVLEQAENVLLIRCVDEIQRAFPELRGHYVYGTVRRNSRVHTAFRPPTADSLHLQTPWPALYACGDWIGYSSPALWMERAVTTGIAAANAVLQTHQLEPYPVLQPPPPERLVRVLEALTRAFRHTVGRGLLTIGRLLRRKRV
ncbi:MAG: FAD-dependent oxidoreductase [Anaerolineae bacterium]|nr:FAD-dependent oxidoreductase [Anaerolineae bacterium]